MALVGACVGVGGCWLAFAWLGGPASPRANAQAGKKPEEAGIKSFVEIGPTRELKGGAVVGGVWAFRTTNAGGASAYTVRVRVGDKLHTFRAEDLASFVKLAKAAETKRKGRKMAAGVRTELVKWSVRTVDEKPTWPSFECDLSRGTWFLEAAIFDNLPDAIDSALEDIETIKKSKPVLPW
jgi:hypothetical protein